MKSLFLLLFTFMSVSVYAQNIAFISQKKIFEAIPNYSALLAENDSLKNHYQKELKKESELTSQKVDALLKTYEVKDNESIEHVKARMKANDVDKLNLLVEEDKFTMKKKETYEKQLSEFVSTKIKPLLTKVNTTISNYAVKNKIDMVYIVEHVGTSLAYYNTSKDITQKIIVQLEK